MNQFTLLVFFLGMTFITNAQVTSSASECEYNDQFEQVYGKDAARLAVRYLYKQGLADSASIQIPNEFYEMMLANLAIARNETSDLWQFDVFERYKIHTNGLPSVDQFALMVDRGVDWVAEWISQKTGSGNAQVDQMIKQYDLRIENMEIGDGNLARLNLATSQRLNIPALLRQFRSINGVVLAEETVDPAANRTNIVYQLNTQNGEPFLTFSYHWGNCEKICLYQHDWLCAMDEQSCELIGEARKGDPLSIEMFDFFFRLDVFPNPTTDLVNLHMIGPPHKDVEVCLFDAFGKKMRREAINTQEGQLDVEVSLIDLPVGIYFVSFRNGGSIHTEKILKL